MFVTVMSQPGLKAQTVDPLAGSGELKMTGTVDDYISGGANWNAGPKDGKWTAGVAVNASGKPIYVQIDFLASSPHGPAVGAFWSLEFGTNKVPAELVVGSYTDVQRAAFAEAGHPGLDVGGDGRGCNAISGLFNITALETDCFVNSMGDQLPRVTKFAADFEQHCERGTSYAKGTITFTAPAGVACSSTGGGPGGGSPTPAPPPTPVNFAFVLPDTITNSPLSIGNSGSASLGFTTATLPDFNSGVALSAFSDAPDNSDFNVSVSPTTIAAPGVGSGKVTITTGPMTFPRDYHVSLIATDASGQQYAATFPVSLYCDPPMILALDQPKSVTINQGQVPTLKVAAMGSGPFLYQWYAGHTGQTQFPVSNGDTLKPSVSYGSSDYWVRVSNACGSADSETATVTVAKPANTPTRRR